MKNNFLVLLFLLFAQHLFAQEIRLDGYIVKAIGDTLRGRIVVQDSYTQVEFEQVNTKGYKVYSTEDIISFSIQDLKTFAPQEILEDSVTKKVFAEMLVWGNPMTLFKFGNIFYLKKESKIYLLDKKESKYDNAREVSDHGKDIHVIVNKRYVGILNYLMLDCTDKSLKNYINGARLEDQSLIRVVEMYNQCINPASVDATKIKRKALNTIGFRAGVTFTDAKVLNPYKPGGVYMPGYGLNFESNNTFYLGGYSNIQLSRHFSFSPELNYLKRKCSTPLETSSTINFDFTFLQIALPIHYNLYLPNKAVFSFYAGPGIEFLLSNKSGIDNAPRKYVEYAKISITSTELAVFAGVRTMFKISENSSFGLDLRYESTFPTVTNIKVFKMRSIFVGPVLSVALPK